MDITRILRERRVELGVSQLTLAKHCNFKHKSSISLLESGQRQWKFDDILAACELLKLNLHIIEQDYCPRCNSVTVDYSAQVCIACKAKIQDYATLGEVLKQS